MTKVLYIIRKQEMKLVFEVFDKSFMSSIIYFSSWGGGGVHTNNLLVCQFYDMNISYASLSEHAGSSQITEDEHVTITRKS